MPITHIATFLIAVLWSLSATADLLQVDTAAGRLQGKEDHGVAAFLGVPYAATTEGKNRWRPPQPDTPWPGIRDATAFGPACYQAPPHMAPGEGPWTEEFLSSGPMSEDCLFVNIWTPAQMADESLPVLVWIHGGAFVGGSGSVPIYHGHSLARQGIVVVTLNYRLGVFGFLAHPDLTQEQGTSGNYGLLDQIAALEWVQANIARFGGDPARVTIAGQSAGAASVHALIASPRARGLFVRAIAQSGSGMGVNNPPLADAEHLGQRVQRTAGANAIDDLRALPAAQVLEASLSPGIAPPGLRYMPVRDAVVLPDPGASASNVPVLTGYTADETSAGGNDWRTDSRQALEQLIVRRFGDASKTFAGLYDVASDSSSQAAARALLRDRALAAMLLWADARETEQPVYSYLFAHAPPGPPDGFGSFHTAEVPYTFNTLDAGERHYGSADRELADTMSRYWVNFVKNGNPNGGDLPPWPPLADHGRMMVFDAESCRVQPVLAGRKQRAFRDFANSGGQLGMF